MKKSLLSLSLILAISLASALSFTAHPVSKTFVKEFADPTIVTLKIYNATPGTYRLYTLADFEIEPFGFFEITKKNTIKNFTFQPSESLAITGFYTFTATLQKQLAEKATKKFTFQILPLKDIVKIYSETANPNTKKIKIFVENTKDVPIQNLSVEFSSIVFKFQKNFSLKPFEKKVFEATPKENIKNIQAGTYLIESTFKRGSKKIKIDGKLYIGEKEGISTDETKSGILIYTHKISKTNIGNVKTPVRIEITKNWFTRIFTTFNIKPTIKQKQGFFHTKYIWIRENLQPGESLSITAKTNYILPIIAVIGLVLLASGINRYTKAKLILEKKILPVKTKSKVFACKVVLTLKAKESLENTSIIDEVPPMFKVYKDFGTTKPDKIDIENRRLHWNIGDLDAGEQRTVSYIMYSKLKLIGKFSLPEAIAVFEKNNAIEEIASNKVFFERKSED